MILLVGESFDTLLILNLLFGFSLLVVFVTLVLSVRKSGQLLFDSVKNETTSSKIRNLDVTNPDGSFETYHPNGVLQIRGTKLNDNLHGEYEEYYPNGSIKVRGTYDNGSVVGKLMTYYDNGELKG